MGFGGDTRHLRSVSPNRPAAMCKVKELEAGLGMLRGDDERCRTKVRTLGKRRLTLTFVTGFFAVEETVEI